MAVDRGIDAEALPPARLCNWIEHLLLANRRDDDIEKMKIEDWLTTPPKGVKGERPGYEADSEMQAFKAAMMANAAAGYT